MEFFNTSIAAKFSGLLFFLKRSKKEFEIVADEINDSSLRSALNSLSDESNYYAGEIKNCLKAFGYKPSGIEDDISSVEDYPAAENANYGGELMNICTQNETTLTKAYSDLLSESIPFQSLKEIMLCQLNALQYTFTKIKTLNSARFAVLVS